MDFNMSDKLKKSLRFFKKGNFTVIKLAIAIVISFMIATVFEYKIYHKIEPFISKNRIIFLAGALVIFFLHLIIKLDEMYGFIYRHRYKIACAFLLFVMIGKYSGSSITTYNHYIQSDIDSSRYHTLLGIARSARSDEWASSTDYILSQGIGESRFSYFSDKLRGSKTDMFTLVNAPVLDILMLGKPFQMGFLLFGNDMGLSFYWYIRLVAMLLGSFELCMIVTNKNKRISLLGCIMITFSAAVQWWYCLDCLIWAQIALVLVNLFFETDKKWIKYCSAGGILISLLSYLFILYPPWQLPFAYFMLAMLVWIIMKNWKNYKINLHDVIVIIVTVICFLLLVFRWYSLSAGAIHATMNTAYPGARIGTGGASVILHQYIYNIFMSFDECPNACEWSSMLSFFPLPMLLAIIYLVRNRKKEHFMFLIPMLLVSLFMTIWCKYGFPEWLAKITLMSMSGGSRASLILGTINIYILIYIIGNIKEEEKLIKWWIGIILGILVSGFVIYKATTELPEEGYITIKKIIIATVIFVPMFVLLFNIKNKKCQIVFMFLAIFTAFASGLCVNPIIRTTDIIYDKPLSRKIAEIRNQDEDAVWVSDNSAFPISNYMVANGIRTIGSTSVYPDIMFFEKLLGDKAEEQEYNYNRYAHNAIFLTTDESHIDLKQTDYLFIYLNYNDLEKFNVKYILSNRNLNRQGFDREFEMLYYEDGMYIFKVN